MLHLKIGKDITSRYENTGGVFIGYLAPVLGPIGSFHLENKTL